jgi:hypothetical protein
MSEYMEQRVVNDIGKFYSQKVHRITEDILDSCDRMDLDQEKVAAMVISVLGSELLNFAIHIEMEEKEFVSLCTVGFRKLSK